MGAIAILNVLLQTVPAAMEAYLKLRDTLSATDLAQLDAQLMEADRQVTADAAALAAS